MPRTLIALVGTSPATAAALVRALAKDSDTTNRDRIRVIKSKIAGEAGINLKRSDRAEYDRLEKELEKLLGEAGDAKDAVALVGPVGSLGAPLTSTSTGADRVALQEMAYREMMAPGLVPLVGAIGTDAAHPLECDKCGKKFEGAHAGLACPKCGSEDTMLVTTWHG